MAGVALYDRIDHPAVQPLQLALADQLPPMQDAVAASPVERFTQYAIVMDTTYRPLEMTVRSADGAFLEKHGAIYHDTQYRRVALQVGRKALSA